MKSKILGFLTLIILTTSLLYYFKPKNKDLFLPEIVDYPHKIQRNALFEKADAYKYAQDYKKADAEFQLLLKQPLADSNKHYVLNQLAYINLTMNEDSVAYKWIQLLEKNSTPLSKNALADYHFNIGVWAYHTFKPKMAEGYLQKARLEYQELYGEKHLRIALCLTQLGLISYEFGELPDIIFDLIPKAYDIFQKNKVLKKHSGLCELGMAYANFLKRGTIIAELHCDNAIHLIKSEPIVNQLSLARALSYKGLMVKKKGDFCSDTKLKKQMYEKAGLVATQATALVSEQNPRYQEMLRNQMIINIFNKDSGDFHRNLSLSRKSVDRIGNFFTFEERLLGNYNVVITGKRDVCTDYYKRFWKKYAQDSLVGQVLKTETYYNLIATLSDTTLPNYNPEKSVKIANVWLNGKFSSYNTFDKIDHKIDILHQSTKTMYAFIPLDLIAKSYWYKYQKYSQLADLKTTIDIFKLADSLLFEQTNVLENDVMMRFQMDIGNTLYPVATRAVHEYFIKTHDKKCIDDAFLFMERLKSSILFRDIELLSNKDSIGIMKSELDKLLGQLDVEKRALFNITDRIAFLNRELEKKMLLKNTTKEPQFSVIDIQQKLNNEQAIIQYNVNTTQTIVHAIYISRDTTVFYQFLSIDFKKHLENYSNQIKMPHKTGGEFGNSAYFLYQKLLAPFEKDLLKRNDLVIIPDRNIHQIPFECFLTTPHFKDFKSADYLIKREGLNISYAPSWKIYALNLLKEEIQLNDKVLCFSYGESTDEIPCSMDEINCIKNNFGKEAHIFINENCTKSNFLANWNKHYGILHLSLHAQGKTDSIFNNKIWFQPHKKDALYGFELIGNHTSFKLVVLSACETNVGNTDISEGVYSMARYFFQAGAKSVIASLWQIDDCPNALVMKNFYSGIKKTPKTKQALCEAKRLFLKEVANSYLANPSYWAGMVCLN